MLFLLVTAVHLHLIYFVRIFPDCCSWSIHSLCSLFEPLHWNLANSIVKRFENNALDLPFAFDSISPKLFLLMQYDLPLLWCLFFYSYWLILYLQFIMCFPAGTVKSILSHSDVCFFFGNQIYFFPSVIPYLPSSYHLFPLICFSLHCPSLFPACSDGWL